MFTELINGDCMAEMDKLINKGVKFDAIITDPPYGTVKGAPLDGWGGGVKTDWDNRLNTVEMFNKCERLLKQSGALILFAQEPYTQELTASYNRHTNIEYCYKYIYLKKHHANSLFAKKAPLNYFEEVLIFRRKYDIYNEEALRDYATIIYKYIGKSLKDINKELGHRKAEHFFYLESTQFALCTREIYEQLTEKYGLSNQSWFINYDELELLKPVPTFNLPKNQKFKKNILEYSVESTVKGRGLHPTIKPVALIEDLVKTYTNNAEWVLDFAMGSGTTGVACKNLNRRFTGIEIDDRFFKIAENRINENL
jgi:site-specific DNA-methyltransferase (adenine-specific)